MFLLFLKHLSLKCLKFLYAGFTILLITALLATAILGILLGCGYLIHLIAIVFPLFEHFEKELYVKGDSNFTQYIRMGTFFFMIVTIKLIIIAVIIKAIKNSLSEARSDYLSKNDKLLSKTTE